MESELAVEYSDAAVTIANILTSFEQAIRMLVLEENPLSSLDFVRMNLSRFVSRGDLIERGGYSDVYRGVLTSLKKKKPNWSWLRPLSWCRRVQPIEVSAHLRNHLYSDPQPNFALRLLSNSCASSVVKTTPSNVFFLYVSL